MLQFPHCGNCNTSGQLVPKCLECNTNNVPNIGNIKKHSQLGNVFEYYIPLYFASEALQNFGVAKATPSVVRRQRNPPRRAHDTLQIQPLSGEFESVIVGYILSNERYSSCPACELPHEKRKGVLASMAF